ncbi:MAG: class I SAM-dependent methyltransferase [Pseudobacter sp.]|uniref:class I SAM-dependent methyltransferase n=1 Tax=Pseudobacter sp. TaxID=2045420 RepID=UPI003F80377F
MPVSLHIQKIQRTDFSIELFVPDAKEVQEEYFRQRKGGADLPFPHWTRLWPSAFGMADFIAQHPELVQNKVVLELAAGLGLPGFVAARYAKSVCCSDYLDAAVTTMLQSVKHLQLANTSCRLLDWNNLPTDLEADVLLLSDINYDPEQFEQLYIVLQRFLLKGTVILLATPQRLMARPFIERLLPYCRQQSEIQIDHQQQITFISLLVLGEGVV